jgi:hypothetical protein
MHKKNVPIPKDWPRMSPFTGYAFCANCPLT